MEKSERTPLESKTSMPKKLTAQEARRQAMEKIREEFRKEMEGADLGEAFRLLQKEAHRNGGILPGSSPNSVPNESNAPPIVPEEFRPSPS